MKYECYISSKMREVTEVLTNTFVNMNHCVVEYGRNLIVEVPKQMCEIVRLELKKYFSDVALMKNAYYMFDKYCDTQAEFWGFKEEPLPLEEMKKIYAYMKAKGKKTFLEVVAYSEKEGIRGAEIAL